MIERGQHLRFALEARHAFGVLREGRRQNFDGDVAIQFGIACTIDLAHPARADGCEDFVGSEA